MEKIKTISKYILIALAILFILAHLWMQISKTKSANYKQNHAVPAKSLPDTILQKDIWKNTEFME